ncbi:MAG: hypothetical protein C0404_10830 [Verrucomicrobia bacterium]|nr:hypothetical protein [Verrucomicrobiota bacterium]
MWRPLACYLACMLLACSPMFAQAPAMSWPNMLSERERKAAYETFDKTGVELTIQEPAGVARKAEPVTSGLPLPEGRIMETGSLCLQTLDGNSVPCQFTVQSRWPNQSLKWVLADFMCSVAASNAVGYTLREGKPAAVETQVRVEQKEAGVFIDTGRLQMLIETNSPGLIHSIRCDGKQVVAKPVQIVLVDASNTVFHLSKPTKVSVETQGALRSTFLVQAEFLSDNGGKIFGGRVGVDLWVTAYAGKPYVKLDARIRQGGFYGYRNEKGRPRQWLYFRSLALTLPIVNGTQFVLATDTEPSEIDVGGSVVQWMRYAEINARALPELITPREEMLVKQIWPTVYDGPYKGFYWTSQKGTNLAVKAGTLSGVARVKSGDKSGMTVAVRRFYENFPAGFSLEGGNFSFLIFPEGGFWPRTKKAADAGTYQLEGGRYKTAQLIVSFAPDAEPTELVAMVNEPLFAKAAGRWYGDTGAVVPMAGSLPAGGDKELVEAWQRYDRLQRAKVNDEFGDPAKDLTLTNSLLNELWGKVSIPSLWQRAPDVFMGWMNYGDLIWGYGYCSLYYEMPYTMFQHYLRLGDREFLDVGSDMIRHRYDIDQYHVESSQGQAGHLDGYQRYEKGEHGNLDRQASGYGEKAKNWEINCKSSHTWNRDLLLHWALTGDPRSLETAEQNGRAFERSFTSDKKWSQGEGFDVDEFRVSGWAMENWLGLYEYSGKTQWLARTEQVFEKTLLYMERKNGGKGQIIKDGHQSSQFVAIITEPVCRLHHYTGRKDVADFLIRVLTYQRKSRSAGGYEKDGGVYPTIWQTGEWEHKADDPDGDGSKAYSIALLDGYAYCARLTGDRADLEFARRLFKEFIFYYGVPDGSPRDWRTPLGFHLLGTPIDCHAAKHHAWSGRYGQLYMAIDGAWSGSAILPLKIEMGK